MFFIVFHLLAIFFRTDTLWDLISDFPLPADGTSVMHGPVICEDIVYYFTCYFSAVPTPKQAKAKLSLYLMYSDV
jgi:hypothetical protein